MEGYAIVLEKVLASCVGEFDTGHIELSRGMMVEYRRTTERYCNIIIRDFYTKNHAFENNLYLCKSSALYQVQSSMWPFLVAINDPLQRATMAKDRPFTDYILSLDIDGFCTVNGQYFQYAMDSHLDKNRNATMALDYQCIVKYIGPVGDLGPGHFFGLQLVVILSRKKAK
jgi:hypothetical protein